MMGTLPGILHVRLIMYISASIIGMREKENIMPTKTHYLESCKMCLFFELMTRQGDPFFRCRYYNKGDIAMPEAKFPFCRVESVAVNEMIGE